MSNIYRYKELYSILKNRMCCESLFMFSKQSLNNATVCELCAFTTSHLKLICVATTGGLHVCVKFQLPFPPF